MTKILFLAANPLDTDPLRLDEEVRAIDTALRRADFRDQFELVSHWAVRTGELQELLLRHQPQIVHFSGHGSETSEIILQDDGGNSAVVPARALSSLFGLLREHIRCVLLNACYSAEQAAGIAEEIDCVVGMSNAITDAAALQFAAAFYRGLGYGRSVAMAFDLGCNQIDLADLDEAHKPALQGVADPERLFFVEDEKMAEGAKNEDQGSGPPWWDRMPTTVEDLDIGDVGGDVIIANVGAGSKNVAVGKNIRQTVYEAVGEPTPDDRAIIEQQMALLAESLDVTHRQQAQFPLQLLETELTKTGDDETPSGSAIIQAGDFLLDNLPDIAEALAALFALPAVGRVLGKSGQETIEWLKRRFG